jgi:hypothetical protein
MPTAIMGVKSSDNAKDFRVYMAGSFSGSSGVVTVVTLVIKVGRAIVAAQGGAMPEVIVGKSAPGTRMGTVEAGGCNDDIIIIL